MADTTNNFPIPFAGNYLMALLAQTNFDPFQYLNGDEKQIIDINFEGTPLRVGITALKNDANVDDFVNLDNQNKWVVDLYIEHNGYDTLNIRDQAEIMGHDEGNESSDAYCSSDDEDLGFVDFHTEVDDNLVIMTLTTNDPFMNKLCSNNGHFRGFIDEPMNANVERVVEDIKSINLEFNVKQGMTYLRHDPTHDWNRMEPVLGMRFENHEQLKLCLANYGVANGYQLWYKRNYWREVLVFYGRDVETGKKAGNGDGFVRDLNGECFPILSSQVQSSSKSYDNEYMNVNVSEEDNVNDSNKMNANDVVDNVNDSSDVSASVDMTGNVEMHVNNVVAGDNVGNKNVVNNVIDKNCVDTVNGKVDNTEKSESIVHLNNGDATIKEKYDMNIVGEKNSNSINRNKLVDIVNTARLDNKLLVIPTESDDKGNEVVSFNEARYHLRRMWNQFGMEDMQVNDGGVLLFKLHDEVGMEEVVTKGPWMVNNKPPFVQKWTVDLCLDQDEPNTLPIWVNMVNVHVEAWSTKGISALASSNTPKICGSGMVTEGVTS
ncbi:zinc finger, PMZ-type containing protein [Tanacetum coccineum]